VTFVIGILADKDAGGILAALAPLAARIVFTASGNPRAAAPDALRALLPAGAATVPVEVVQEAAAALARATFHVKSGPVESDQARSGLVCVAGSLSLVGDVLGAVGDGQDVLFTTGARC
jgi:dihydrofolate synthase/folylpolyglutamate synthase